jgi:hypothetical protein
MKEATETERPICHSTPMSYEFADDGPSCQVEFWECKHCGHTKAISETYHGF